MKKIFLILGAVFSLQVYSSSSMDGQWKSYHDQILKTPDSAKKLALEALKSEDWYMREAGLKTLLAVDAQLAKQKAQDLLKSDPAMLVRSSAVKVLKLLNDASSEELLWKSLEDKKNFRKDQSLWIRPQIMATLLKIKAKSIENFKKFYEDRDPQVASLARSAQIIK